MITFTQSMRRLGYVIACHTAMIVAGLWLLATMGSARVTEIGPIGLVVDNLEREVAFFTTVLPFEVAGTSELGGAEAEQLYGISGAHTRTIRLRLGGEQIALTEFIAPKGRAIPMDSRSYDHWFQHIAIVVRDMDAAYARLLAHRVRHVSTAPQTLPLSNPNAGGIKAFYFQDPEGHVLEIIWFPAGKGDPRWQQSSDALFLGIDHTAIVVSDTERSLGFYRDALGLRIAGGAENFGPEQEHLNQVFGARLRITALRGSSGPGVEFLEYIAPPGGRPLPTDARLNDLVAWTVTFHDPEASETLGAATSAGGQVLMHANGQAVVRDPDGHALKLEASAATVP